MITYIDHSETEGSKAHTDILLNNEYIGYYIKENDTITAFIEMYGEMNAGEFENTEQLELKINGIIEEYYQD